MIKLLSVVLLFLFMADSHASTYIASAVKDQRIKDIVPILLGMKYTGGAFERWYKSASNIAGFKEAYDEAAAKVGGGGELEPTIIEEAKKDSVNALIMLLTGLDKNGTEASLKKATAGKTVLDKMGKADKAKTLATNIAAALK